MAINVVESGSARPAGTDGGTLLRLSLKLDAVVCGAFGALSLAAGPVLDPLLGTTPALRLLVGLFLLAYAAAIGVGASLPGCLRLAGLAAVTVNLLWAAGSVALVASGGVPLTGLGIAFVLAQAGAVVIFAAMQALGLRRARPTAA